MEQNWIESNERVKSTAWCQKVTPLRSFARFSLYLLHCPQNEKTFKEA